MGNFKPKPMMFAFLIVTLIIGASSHSSMVKPINWFDKKIWMKTKEGWKWDYIGMSSMGQCLPGGDISPSEICKTQDCFDFGKPGTSCLWYKNYTFVEKPTIFDSKLLTYPRALQPEKLMRHPWRAPGSAPIDDPCGVSGGNLRGCIGDKCAAYKGGYGYGEKGTQYSFKHEIKVTNWKKGSTVEVAWAIVANHGGGYSYRLCKIPNEGVRGLTEECFQNTPLKFVGDKQWIQYGDDTSTKIEIPAVRTTMGTFPNGSEWTRNPIPACVGVLGGYYDHNATCPRGKQFPPVKPFLYGFGVNIYGTIPFFKWSIVDLVKIPDDLSPGGYVLSFRWDCEQTPQVWNTCASILIE